MLTAPTLPNVAELEDRALADRAFLDEITAAEERFCATPLVAAITSKAPRELWARAKLAAERAAEQWQRTPGALDPSMFAALAEYSQRMLRKPCDA